MLLLLLFPTLATAATIEVAPGDDIVTLTASLGPGSEIVFAGGVYEIADDLAWTGVGTESEPIVLRAKDGETPIIELTAGGRIVTIQDAAHVHVRGLRFKGSEAHLASEEGFSGLRIENSTSIRVEDCAFTDIDDTAITLAGDNDDLRLIGNEIGPTDDGHGIYVGCWDALCWTANSEIRGNWIHDLGGEWHVGVLLEPGSQNITIADNVIYRASARGIQVESTEYSPSNVVEGNAIWNVSDAGIGVYGSAIVRNNLVHNVEGRGIRSEVADNRVFEKVVISFNTVVNSGSWGIEIDHWADREGMVLANNAVANPTGYAFDADEGQLGAENYISGNRFTGLVEGLEAFPDAYLPGGGYEDFQDAEGWDFYPRPGSTLVDGGDPSSQAWVPDVDFNNSLRDGDAPDVGAYEMVATSNPGWPLQEGHKQLVEDQGGEVGQVGGCCGGGKKDTDAAAFLLLPLLGWYRRRRR